MRKPSSYESICLLQLKKNQWFYTNKKDKDITAISTYYKKKVKTERVFVINPQNVTIDKITKVTIL